MVQSGGVWPVGLACRWFLVDTAAGAGLVEGAGHEDVRRLTAIPLGRRRE